MLKMAERMTPGPTIGLRLSDRRGIEYDLTAENPKNAHPRFGFSSCAHFFGSGSSFCPASLPFSSPACSSMFCRTGGMYG